MNPDDPNTALAERVYRTVAGHGLAASGDHVLVALSGGSCNNPEAPARQSLVITLMDPEAFAGRDDYLREIDRFVTHVRSSRKRPGVDTIRLPGERALAALREAERSGLVLADDRRQKLGL